MNKSFVSLDLKYQLFHVGKAIRIQQGQRDTIYRTAVVMNRENMEVWEKKNTNRMMHYMYCQIYPIDVKNSISLRIFHKESSSEAH